MYRIKVEKDLRDYRGFSIIELTKESVENVLITHPVFGIYEKIEYQDGSYSGKTYLDNDWINFTISSEL